ncbi:MAG: hypothetical protein JJ920_16395 [Roseitalea sp.]|jgi:hypothetical protein|nr:hypothetical protein [Roseitalea sp.]MBO6722719.1 hypothetical protein [Roseitalea sp.]MBO6744494.1 hypothetical protein [Roseitalea sp.]
MRRTNAIVTASHAPDFARCAILCESIDRYVTGHSMHYLLVDNVDAPLFRRLEGPKRRVVTETELLPWWLKRVPASLSPGGRRIWVAPRTLPLHGWHVQQIKRIAIARLVDDDGLLYCDSDTVFVKPFDVSAIWTGDDIRLFRATDGALSALKDHAHWITHAGETLGIAPAERTNHDYIAQFVTWRRQTVIDMCDHMERLHGRHWVSVIGRSRRFSECMIYGAYVEQVLDGAGHAPTAETLCPMQWFDPAPTDEELAAVVRNLKPFQVGVGVQSFIAIEPERFRALTLGTTPKAA